MKNRVFMVDDSPIVTKMVSQFLREKGYEVETSNSPFGVSARLRAFRPDIVLMDLGLPGLSGRRLIEIIKKEECGRDCRVILFSSADEDEMKGIVSEGVADGYFLKGNSLNELEHKVRMLAT